MKTKTALLALAAAAALLPATASANTTLFWGGPVEGLHLDSEGNVLKAPEYTFQIGTFGGGLNPATASFDTWAAAWKVFDQATFDNDNNYLDSVALMNTAGLSNGVNADPAFDFRGAKMFMWIFNSNVLGLAGDDLEWALISAEAWEMPVISSEAHALPLEFRFGNADQAFIGAVQPDGTAPVIGALGYYDPSGPYDLQTHSLFPPDLIPEPGTSLLALAGLAGLLVRRQRQA